MSGGFAVGTERICTGILVGFLFGRWEDCCGFLLPSFWGNNLILIITVDCYAGYFSKVLDHKFSSQSRTNTKKNRRYTDFFHIPGKTKRRILSVLLSGKQVRKNTTDRLLPFWGSNNFILIITVDCSAVISLKYWISTQSRKKTKKSLHEFLPIPENVYKRRNFWIPSESRFSTNKILAPKYPGIKYW